MTPAEAIIGRINKGPANIADLACEVHVQCSASPGDMYRIAYAEILTLVKEKRIYRHECGAFMLPPSTEIEADEMLSETATKLRPGTVIPRKFRHLTQFNPSIPPMPNNGKENA